MDWTSPYVDHKVWILDHLESLHLEPKEALALLLIDYYNDMHKTIHHEMIAQKLHIDVEEVENLFVTLADKGYLNITYQQGGLQFDIEGVYSQEQKKVQGSHRSLIEEFEAEFKRTLSSMEMERILQLASYYDERMVICALNEAAVYEKRNLNYIESILVSWKEKGFSVEDVESGKR